MVIGVEVEASLTGDMDTRWRRGGQRPTTATLEVRPPRWHGAVLDSDTPILSFRGDDKISEYAGDMFGLTELGYWWDDWLAGHHDLL